MAHLIFQTAFPGDLFLSLPLIRRLREWSPEVPLVLACRPGLGSFFLQHGFVDRVIEVDKRSKSGRQQALMELTRESWDLILVPHESPRTALWLSRMKVKTAKIGFRRWWNRPFFDLRVEKPKHLPDALRQLSLLAPIDERTAERFSGAELAKLQNPLDQQPNVWFDSTPLPEWAKVSLPRSEVREHKIFLAPGSVWNTKRWLESGYRGLARRLLVEGWQVELVGSAAEVELCERIAKSVPGVSNMAGRTSLAELVDRLKRGAALVCNDSGAMHAAALVNLPTLAIFGPTVLAQGFRPWSERAVVMQTPLPCRPCGKHGAKKCPIGTHECMQALSEETVHSALLQLLKRYPSR